MLICEAVEPDGKSCSKCGQYKPLSAYPPKRLRCRPCLAASTAEHRLNNAALISQRRKARHAAHPERQRDTNLKGHYGLSLTEWDAMWAAQDGACAICFEPLGSGVASATDHDHVSGKVRAILCAHCNRGLGCFRDTPDMMRRAAAYVEAHRASA